MIHVAGSRRPVPVPAGLTADLRAAATALLTDNALASRAMVDRSARRLVANAREIMAFADHLDRDQIANGISERAAPALRRCGAELGDGPLRTALDGFAATIEAEEQAVRAAR